MAQIPFTASTEPEAPQKAQKPPPSDEFVLRMLGVVYVVITPWSRVAFMAWRHPHNGRLMPEASDVSVESMCTGIHTDGRNSKSTMEVKFLEVS